MRSPWLPIVVAISLSIVAQISQADDAPPAVLPAVAQAAPPQAVPVQAVPVQPVPVPTPLELQITGLEQRLFGETHPKETPDLRMNRLEKFVYGAVTPGTCERRIDNLRAAMMQKAPDGTMPSASLVAPSPSPVAVVKRPPEAIPSIVTASVTPTTQNIAGNQLIPVVGASISSTESIPPVVNTPVIPATGSVGIPVTIAPPAGAGTGFGVVVPIDAIQIPMQTPVMHSPLLQGSLQTGQVGARPEVKAADAAPSAPSGTLHLSMAGIAEKVDDPRHTLQSLQEAIQADPIFTADLFYQKAKVELSLRDYKGALKDLSNAILKEPMRYKYYLARAVVYQKIGNSVLADKDIATARYTFRDLPAVVEFDADTKYER